MQISVLQDVMLVICHNTLHQRLQLCALHYLQPSNIKYLLWIWLL